MPHLEFSSLLRLLLQIASILLVSRVLASVMRRVGQPLVIAEVLGGILLGPSLLGWVWPEGMAALFPASSLPALSLISQVGLILFMFLVGLELDSSYLRGKARASVAISQVSIFFPFILGVGVAGWLYPNYAPVNVSFLPFALFMGIAMSITAFPVLVRILTENGIFKTRLGAIATACAAVDDITAWCLLAFVVAISRAQGFAGAIWTTVMALIFVSVMFCLMRPWLKHVGGRVVDGSIPAPAAVAAWLLLLVLSSAITEMIGIHALFGAFLFGAMFPKDQAIATAVAQKVETVAVALLLPLFFAYSGLRTEIGLLNNLDDWLVAAVILSLATLGKFGGATIASRISGLSWKESSAIGVLMNTRGLMELIALNIGMDLGVISPTLFTMLVIMALGTTLVTSPIMRLIYPPGDFKEPQAEERLIVDMEPSGASASPNPQT